MYKNEVSRNIDTKIYQKFQNKLRIDSSLNSTSAGSQIKAYSEPYQTSKMEDLVEMISVFQPFTTLQEAPS